MKKRSLASLTILALAVFLTGCQQAGGAGSSSSSASSAVASSSASSSQAAAPKSNDELYDAAVKDAVFIDADEILPLVNISRDDENVIWGTL